MKLPSLTLSLLLGACSAAPSGETLPQPAATPAGFDAFHESAAEYDARAQWLRNAKFGVFLHWNPSSLVGQEVSWCRKDVGIEKYDNLYKEFKGQNFHAEEWVKLFETAGIRYAVVVPKHHDGFAMWDTKTYDYNVMKSPFGRDYVKEMALACQGSQVQFCLYYSVLDWWNPKYQGHAGADLTAYKNEIFKPQMKELLTQYGKIGCIWFDGHWEASWTHKDGKEMYDYIRRLQPGTLLGNRIDQKAARSGPVCSWTGSFYDGAPDPVGDYQAREADLGEFYMDKAWDCCFSLCGTNFRWSWYPPMTPRPTHEVLGWLIQCIGRDGSLLLGVGPRPDGTIDPSNAQSLEEIGTWTKANGEAIYGTRGGPWHPTPNYVATRKGNKVYLFVTKWDGDELVLPPLPAQVKAVRLLSQAGSASLDTAADGWTLTVPERFHRQPTTIVEITLDQEALKLAPVKPFPAPVNLALRKTATVSSVWPGRDLLDLKPSHITDGNPGTIWAAEEKARSASVSVDLEKDCEIHRLAFSEAPYHRIQSFSVEALVGGQWQKIGQGGSSDANGQISLKVKPMKARQWRLNILSASDTPVLAEFQVFSK